jgi:hypothetical protein
MEYITISLKIIYDKVSNMILPDISYQDDNYNLNDTQTDKIIDKEPTFTNISESDLSCESRHYRVFPKISSVEQMKWFYGEPTHVIDNIYIGSAYNAANKNILNKYNIKYIINVTDDIRNYFPDDIVYVNYKLKDNNKESIIKYFKHSYKKIKEFQKRNNGNILIHCFMGASRSATILAYYVMLKENKAPMEAYHSLRSKRHIVNPTKLLCNELKNSQKNI